MNRLISVTVCIAILIAMFSVSAYALETETMSGYPVVVVPGYSASQMYYTDENGNTEHVWGVHGDVLVAEVMSKIADIGMGLGRLAKGDAAYIAGTVGESLLSLYGKLACNDDGSGKYDLSLYYSSAEDTCSSTLMEKYPDGNFRHEGEIMGEVAEYIGNEKIFNFNCDFRMSTVDCANALDEYIEDVLAYTGAEKVNIIAVSHGGQTTATYLTLYGYKQRVHNAVLNVPAIGGAGLAYDVLAGNFDFDEKTLFNFVEYGMMEETDYNWLVQAQELGFLDDILNEFQPYILELIGNWESIWDFVPAEYYDRMKAMHLDSTDNAELIASSDYVHYTLMPMFQTSLQRCNDEYGMNVSIIAGTENPIVSGLKENSDGIITTKSSTGATTAPYGMRFSDGYSAINGDNSYVSPAMTVDASTAYLPDNTWFVSGLFHGMEYKDSYSAELLMKLLLTDDITSVYSDGNYPRFHATTSNAKSVFAAFDNSPEGRVSSADTAIRITNLSKESEMKLLAVTCKGMNIAFDLGGVSSLQPGETVSIPYLGKIPAESQTCCAITVTYELGGSVTPVNERTLYFTTDNGAAPAYNTDEPYTSMDDFCIEYVPDDVAAGLEGAGLGQIISIFYNTLTQIIVKIAVLLGVQF